MMPGQLVDSPNPWRFGCLDIWGPRGTRWAGSVRGASYLVGRLPLQRQPPWLGEVWALTGLKPKLSRSGGPRDSGVFRAWAPRGGGVIGQGP